MTNKELIKELRDQVHLAEQMMALGDMTNLLEKAANALESQEWQPISTMPFGQLVLIRFSDGHIESQMRTEILREFRESMRFISPHQRKVTHWKPRPDEPEGNTNGN